MGTFSSAFGQSAEEIHRLVSAAVVQHRPIAALYDGARRLLCPHVLGYNQPGERRVFSISTEEKPKADHSPVAVRVSGAAWR
jgi:hypothetical protein